MIGPDTPISFLKVSDLRQVIRREFAEMLAEALAKQAQPAPVGALTAEQTWKFLGWEKTKFHELLKEHPELDAMGIVYKIRKDGKKLRRWPVDELKAWMERRGSVSFGRLLGGGGLILQVLIGWFQANANGNSGAQGTHPS